MLYCIVLCCVVLYCIILYYIILFYCYLILYYITLYNIILYYIILYYITLYPNLHNNGKVVPSSLPQADAEGAAPEARKAESEFTDNPAL